MRQYDLTVKLLNHLYNRDRRYAWGMHPRNPFSKDYPVFSSLALQYPALQKHLRTKTDGSVSLDFADPESSRVLAQAVFWTEYKLRVELPKGHLIPTIPNRVDYILWIEDLLRYAQGAGLMESKDIRGIDVGTGPSCVFPLLGARIHPDWHFTATDVDESSCRVARENVSTNELNDRISIIHNTNPRTILLAAAPLDSSSRFTFAMTNPPFYDGPEDLDACRQLKSNAPSESPEYTASEYFFDGGELSFISIMFEESCRLRDRILWYTSVVAKKSNLKPLRRLIKGHPDVKTYHWTRWIQGSTSRWAIAWSFSSISIDPADNMDKKKKKTDANWHQIISLKTPREFDMDKMKADLASFNIECQDEPQIVILCNVRKNTWCRRSRRGHPPPSCIFHFQIVHRGDTLNFKLPSAHAAEAESFISLVSHLQRKFNLSKK